ncbi:MAG: 50S ribosomal protein L10 [Halanaerobiaceae bacterium]
MATPEKEAAVEELNEKFNQAKSLVFTDYLGLDVAQMTELRAKLRESGVDFKVIKNTLAKIAARDAELEDITEYFSGPTAVAFGMEDVVSPARVLVDFAEENEMLEIKAGYLNGEVIEENKVKSLADIPSKEVLLSKVLAGMQSPLSGLVNVLQGNLRDMVQVLNQIKEQKEG